MAGRYSTRPPKPFKGFPLFAHNNRQWCRKIGGRIYSFGAWENPTAALERHNKEYPYRKAGVPVPDTFDGLKVGDLCNKFLAVKDADRASGEITERWFDDLERIGKLIVAHIDRNRPVESLSADDFRKLRTAIVAKHSPGIARNFIQRAKSFFRFAWENELIAKPVRYGDAFKPPRRSLERKRRAEIGPKVFEPAELRDILEACNPAMRAAMLLMVNCGLSNSDICKLPAKALNLKTGWLDWARPKTGIERRSKLWPETVDAVQKYLADRPSDALPERVFVTRFGAEWTRSALVHEVAKVALKAGVDKGSPEWCRKTCLTIGEEARDIPALRRIMGHCDPSISDHYRERITDSRIQAVTEHIRQWLLSAKPKRKTRTGRKKNR